MSSPEKLTIDTPEHIALEFNLASVGSRFLALAIDTSIQAAGFLVIALAGAAVWGGFLAFRLDARTWVFAGIILAGFVIYYGYFAIFEALWRGQTPGKRTIGLRVIAVSGRPITTYEAILRNVVRIADQMPGVYAVGILTVILNDRSQRLGDLAAGTVVVHEQPIEPHSASIETRPERRVRHRASRLAPDEVALIEAFLRRRANLSDYRRTRTAQEIARRISARLEVTEVDDEERFLEEVAADYRASGRYR